MAEAIEIMFVDQVVVFKDEYAVEACVVITVDLPGHFIEGGIAGWLLGLAMGGEQE